MADKVIFLDIDGPMIPGRAYDMDSQTKPIVMTFDPCAVGLLNRLCHDHDYQIVLHTSWLKVSGVEETYKHCIDQGIKEWNFHKDYWCKDYKNERYMRIQGWLNEHPDVEDFVILDDEPIPEIFKEHHANLASHLILVDFYEGFLYSIYERIKNYDYEI